MPRQARDGARDGAPHRCRARIAPLHSAGEASVYDGRLRHSGSANRGDALRVLFYVTFRHAADDKATIGMRVNNAAHSIRSEYAGKLRLRDLRASPPATSAVTDAWPLA